MSLTTPRGSSTSTTNEQLEQTKFEVGLTDFHHHDQQVVAVVDSASQQQSEALLRNDPKAQNSDVLRDVRGVEVQRATVKKNTKGPRRKQKRQLPYAQGYPSCNYVPNSVLSCFPESNTTLTENIWSKFIFNSQYPTFIGAGKVDIYLYHADSETIATSFLGIETARGMIGIRPDEEWWPVIQQWNAGMNMTWPFFFVIVDANTTLTGGEVHQPTFRAIQTAPPATLLPSISSSLASYSSSSSLSAFSASQTLTSSPSSSTTSTTSSNPNTLQPGNNSERSSADIPKWGIALIVVLSILVLTLLLLTSFLFRRRQRRRRRNSRREQTDDALGGGVVGGSLTDHDEEDDDESDRPIMRQGPERSISVSAGSSRAVPTNVNSLRTSEAQAMMRGRNDSGLSESDAKKIEEAFRNELRRPPPLPVLAHDRTEGVRQDSDEAVLGEGNWTPDDTEK